VDGPVETVLLVVGMDGKERTDVDVDELAAARVALDAVLECVLGRARKELRDLSEEENRMWIAYRLVQNHRYVEPPDHRQRAPEPRRTGRGLDSDFFFFRLFAAARGASHDDPLAISPSDTTLVPIERDTRFYRTPRAAAADASLAVGMP
jgi:hypothetical protein